jgi:putative transcriptional regulator
MGEKRVRIIDVARATGISRNLLAKLYHDRARRTDIDDLGKLCQYFGHGTETAAGKIAPTTGGPSWEITECGSPTVARAKLVRSVKLRHYRRLRKRLEAPDASRAVRCPTGPASSHWGAGIWRVRQARPRNVVSHHANWPGTHFALLRQQGETPMNRLTVFRPLAPGCATAAICPTLENRYT